MYRAHNLEVIALLVTQDHTKVDKPLRVSMQWRLTICRKSKQKPTSSETDDEGVSPAEDPSP